MIGALLVMSLAHVTAATPGDDFDRGVALRENARLARGAFARAADGFDRAWQETPSPAMAVARGRAHFLAGDLPKSLAAVHDGLELTPYDAELQGDLKAIRGTIRYPQPTDPALRVRPDELLGLRFRVSPWDAYSAGVCFGVVAVVGIVFALTSRPRWAFGAALVGVVGVGASGLLAWQIDRDRPPSVAILTADTVLRRGNGMSYSPRMAEMLPRGTEVRPTGERGGWLQVELPGGAVGWVPESNTLK